MRRVMKPEATCPKHRRTTCGCPSQRQATACQRPVHQ